MKILLIAEDMDSKEELKQILTSYSFELIHYKSPIKALDNITEIMPEAIIINTLDFPRHWKVITQHVRWDNSKEKILIILLTSEKFSESEAYKAINTGVQGIIKLGTRGFSAVLPEIKNILSRYYTSETEKTEKIASDHVQFLFTNPITETIITGTVKHLTKESIIFAPDTLASVSDIDTGTLLDQCSLKLNNILIIPICKIAAKSSTLELSFVDLSEKDQTHIQNFLNG